MLLASMVFIALFLLTQQISANPIQTMSYLMLYIGIPVLGIAGCQRINRLALLITFIGLALTSVRSISTAWWVSPRAPISFAIPIGDFARGDGFLVDLFPVLIMMLIGYLLFIIHGLKINKR